MACKNECVDGVCTSTSTQGYVGTPVTQEVTWGAGQKVTIDVRGGNVRFGNTASAAITVNPGAPDGKILITFTPINNETEANKDKAVREMNSPANGGSLTFNAGPGADGSVAISNVLSGTHSSGLSARIDVRVPANFDGDISAIADSGDVSIAGVNKTVVASTAGIGNVVVELNAPLPAGLAGGRLFSDKGDVALRLPAASNITIKSTADGIDASVGLEVSALPAGWTETRAAVNSATYVGNLGSATDWTVDTKSGKVFIKPF